jgi:hypothetical protein
MARRRGREDVRDMVLSLLVVSLFILGTMALVGGSLGVLSTDSAARDVRPVDYSSDLAVAVDRADYQVLEPVDVPDTWVSQSARVQSPEAGDGATVLLQIGFLTDGQRFASVVQSDEPASTVLAAQSLTPDPEARVEVDGDTWAQHRRTDRDEIALVRTAAGSTVVLTGDARLDELRLLAGSLRPAGEGPREIEPTEDFQPVP